MAAGKNVACQIFESLGWKSIDADAVVHDAVKKLTPQILDAFESDARAANITLTNADGSLNRRTVGQLIFGKPELVARQESIVYPEVIEQIKKFCGSYREANTIINATVLFKTPDLMQMCDAVVFVTAPFFTRLRRAARRDRLPLSAILARFKSQRNLLQKYKTAAWCGASGTFASSSANANAIESASAIGTSHKKNIPVYVVRNSGNVKTLEKKIKKLAEKYL